MNASNTNLCRRCGMHFETSIAQCPKCDYGVFDQNITETYTQDIAHNYQTVSEATQEFCQALATARQQNYGYLRLIVGGGKIREEVRSLLESEQWRGTIKSFSLDQPNSGAYLAKLSFNEK